MSMNNRDELPPPSMLGEIPSLLGSAQQTGVGPQIGIAKEAAKRRDDTAAAHLARAIEAIGLALEKINGTRPLPPLTEPSKRLSRMIEDIKRGAAMLEEAL